MRALNSAVTGIRSHQTRMDVIGNNIANVNTVGFKSSRVTFKDVFSQTLTSGSATTNPQQVGLGVGVASTDMDMNAGSPQLTGRELDLAIQGDGFFITRNGDNSVVYTRVGSFDWSPEGVLVIPGTGARVQGYAINEDGTVATGALGDILLRKGSTAAARPTTTATITGNLDPTARILDDTDENPFVDATTTLTVYDSLGRPNSLVVNILRLETEGQLPEWSVEVLYGEEQLVTDEPLTFDPTTGEVDPPTLEIPFTPLGLEEMTINLDVSGLQQAYTGTPGSTLAVQSSDGAPMGTLESVSISQDGQVIGVYSNGARVASAYVALANFTNPAGLSKVGDTSFSETASSGVPMVGLPNTEGRGQLVPSNLEGSNVDLSTEFTNMIMTQRGFQANTRVVSTADEMLQDLVNLRR